MKVNSDRLFRVLSYLESALGELQEASKESPTDRSLKNAINIALGLLAVLRFYVATQGQGKI
jgi:hypothetical protein